MLPWYVNYGTLCMLNSYIVLHLTPSPVTVTTQPDLTTPTVLCFTDHCTFCRHTLFCFFEYYIIYKTHYFYNIPGTTEDKKFSSLDVFPRLLTPWSILILMVGRPRLSPPSPFCPSCTLSPLLGTSPSLPSPSSPSPARLDNLP